MTSAASVGVSAAQVRPGFNPDDIWRINPVVFAAALTHKTCLGCQYSTRTGMQAEGIPHTHFATPPHIQLIGRAVLEALTGKGPPRILIEAPPRHGKSFFVDQWLPAWFLNTWPHRYVMLATYEADFAAKWGRLVRDTLDLYKNSLAVQVNPKSTAADHWDTTAGGGMATAGVGGPFTGRGAHLLLLDDLLKNAEEAASQVRRDAIWEWLCSTALTRLEPGGITVHIMTRWNEDDPMGRIKNLMAKGEMPPWRIIRLPALAEKNDELGRNEGEALWPERYSVAALASIKRLVGSWVWSALYQQHPTTPEGNFFRRKWFDHIERAKLPPMRRIVRFWDLAATTVGESGNSDPDWATGVRMGISETGVYFVTDVTRLRGTPMEIEHAVRRCARADGPDTEIYLEQEPGSAGKALISHYQRDVLPGFNVRGVKTSGSKTTRATGQDVLRADHANSAAERGDVKLVSAPWNDEFLGELAAFPNGKHDDQVDAFTGAFNQLARKMRGWDIEKIRAQNAGFVQQASLEGNMPGWMKRMIENRMEKRAG